MILNSNSVRREVQYLEDLPVMLLLFFGSAGGRKTTVKRQPSLVASGTRFGRAGDAPPWLDVTVRTGWIRNVKI